MLLNVSAPIIALGKNKIATRFASRNNDGERSTLKQSAPTRLNEGKGNDLPRAGFPRQSFMIGIFKCGVSVRTTQNGGNNTRTKTRPIAVDTAKGIGLNSLFGRELNMIPDLAWPENPGEKNLTQSS